MGDVLAVFNLIVDTLAMLPQMYVVSKAEDEADALTRHVIGIMCLARFIRMLFWTTFYGLYDHEGGAGSRSRV